MEKELKIEIPEGYEIDKEKSIFEKIVFKKKENYCLFHDEIDDAIENCSEEEKMIYRSEYCKRIEAIGLPKLFFACRQYNLRDMANGLNCNKEDMYGIYFVGINDFIIAPVKTKKLLVKYRNKKTDEVIYENKVYHESLFKFCTKEAAEKFAEKFEFELKLFCTLHYII